jgi:hypothetical protein
MARVAALIVVAFATIALFFNSVASVDPIKLITYPIDPRTGIFFISYVQYS